MDLKLRITERNRINKFVRMRFRFFNITNLEAV